MRVRGGAPTHHPGSVAGLEEGTPPGEGYDDPLPRSREDGTSAQGLRGVTTRSQAGGRVLEMDGGGIRGSGGTTHPRTLGGSDGSGPGGPSPLSGGSSGYEEIVFEEEGREDSDGEGVPGSPVGTLVRETQPGFRQHVRSCTDTWVPVCTD